MSGHRKRINSLHLLLSLLFIILLIGGAWYFAVTYKPPTTEEYIDRALTSLEDWANFVGVEAKPRESIYWEWTDEKNNLVPLTGNEFILGTVDVNGIGQYGDVTSKHLEKITAKFFAPLLSDTNDYFDKNRFVEDKTNAREKENDPLHAIRKGFQHGNIYCLLRLTPMSDPFGAFFCGTVDQKQMALQKKVAGLFSTKYNPKHFSAFRVTKIENEFAIGTYWDDVSGYTWIGKNVNGEWSMIWHGEELPQCSDVEEKGIPKSIYLQCYK